MVRLSEKVSGVYMSRYLLTPLEFEARWAMPLSHVCNTVLKPTLYIHPIDAKFHSASLAARGASSQRRRFEQIELRLHRLMLHPNTPRTWSPSNATALYIPVYVWDHCPLQSNGTCPLEFWRSALDEIGAEFKANRLKQHFIPAMWDWAACGFNCMSNANHPTCSTKGNYLPLPRHGIPTDIMYDAGQISLLGDMTPGVVCYRPSIDIVVPPYMEHMCSEYCELESTDNEVCMWETIDSPGSVATIDECAQECFNIWGCVGFVFSEVAPVAESQFTPPRPVYGCVTLMQYSVGGPCDTFKRNDNYHNNYHNRNPHDKFVVFSSRHVKMYMKATEAKAPCNSDPVRWYNFVFACPEPIYPKKYKLYFRGLTATNHARAILIDALKGMPNTLLDGQYTGSEKLYPEFQVSEFCLVPPGLAPWSYRLFETVSMLCIPVITDTSIQKLPFEDQLDYTKFSVLISDNDPEKVRDAVWGSAMTPERQKDMLVHLREARKVFHYTSDTHDLLMRELF
eukprot:c13158_g1_i3.p1 GENE.c13158_g1_i3~~c13158_g1_i3.p1  ORF type:complete len:590 (-),score=167.43 c13158_g1_i3:360-1889(-)